MRSPRFLRRLNITQRKSFLRYHIVYTQPRPSLPRIMAGAALLSRRGTMAERGAWLKKKKQVWKFSWCRCVCLQCDYRIGQRNTVSTTRRERSPRESIRGLFVSLKCTKANDKRKDTPKTQPGRRPKSVSCLYSVNASIVSSTLHALYTQAI